MIEYGFYSGEYDEVLNEISSVSLTYWLINEPEFEGIDQQFVAQFLGLI